jgi:hypothetical protein
MAPQGVGKTKSQEFSLECYGEKEMSFFAYNTPKRKRALRVFFLTTGNYNHIIPNIACLSSRRSWLFCCVVFLLASASLPCETLACRDTTHKGSMGAAYEISCDDGKGEKPCEKDWVFSNLKITANGRQLKQAIRLANQEIPNQAVRGFCGDLCGSIPVYRDDSNIEKDHRFECGGNFPLSAAVEIDPPTQLTGPLYAQETGQQKSTSPSAGIKGERTLQPTPELPTAEALDCEKLFQEHLKKFQEMVQFYSELNMEIQGRYSGSGGDVWGFSAAVIRDGFIVRYCSPKYVSCSKAVLDEYFQCLTDCNEKWVYKKPRTAQDRRDRKDERNRCFQEANKKIKECIELHKLPPSVAEKPPLETPTNEEPSSELEESRDSGCYEDRLNEEIRNIQKIQDAVAYADQEYQNQKMKLGIMRIAAGKKQNKIKYLKGIIKGGNFSAEMKLKLENTVEQLEYDVLEIQRQRDEEVKYALYNYDDVLRRMRKAYQDSKCDDVKRVLKSLGEENTKKRTFIEFELLLAASNTWERDGFYAVTNKYLVESKYRDIVFLMRALDYIEQKDPRSALYALRKSVDENPDNKTAQEMLKNIEAGYLRSIDEKTLGEAAGIRSELWSHLEEHGEEGFLGVLKDILTTGVTASASAIGGKPMALVDLGSTIGDEALVQHAGLILVIRLREAGVPLDEVDSFSNEELIAETQKLFNWTITEKEALKLRFSIKMAFNNPDVRRLSGKSKQIFDIDSGASYFKSYKGESYLTSDEFDEIWRDWVGDVVNIKNVITMLGPSAVISSSGKLAIHGSKLAKDTFTVRDAFTNLIRLPDLADKFAKTTAGRACIQELFKFDQNTGVISKMVAEALVQQGMIKVGEKLGGRGGAFAAEVLTTLGVGDIDQTLRILNQNGVTPETLARLAGKLRKAAEGVEDIGAVSKRYKDQLEFSIEEVTTKGAISPTTKKQLEQSCEELEKVTQNLTRKAQLADISLVQQQQYEQLRVMKSAFSDAMSGNRAGAKAGQKTVENLEEQSRSAIERLAKQADTVDDLTNGLKKADMEITYKPKMKDDPIEVLAHDNGLEGCLVEKKPISKRSIRIEADQSVDIKYTRKTMDGKNKPGTMLGLEEADDAMLRQDYDGATRLYYEQYLKTKYSDDYSHYERYVIYKKYRDAAEAKLAADAFSRKRLQGAVNEEITIAYTSKDLDDITTKIKSCDYTLERVETPSATKAFCLKDETGNRIAVVKPTDPKVLNKWDIKGEVLSHRISQKLKNTKLKTPATAKITLEIDGKPTECAVIRYVKGADLEDNTLGVQYNVKKQLGESKAKSLIMLDHDRHSGNYKVDDIGEAFDIDRGFNGIGRAMEQPAEELDAYVKNMAEQCVNQPAQKDVIIRNLENHITYDDIDPVVKQMEGWDESTWREILDGIVESEDEMQKVIKVLNTNMKYVREILQERFPTIDVTPLKSDWKMKDPLDIEISIPVLSLWHKFLKHGSYCDLHGSLA